MDKDGVVWLDNAPAKSVASFCGCFIKDVVRIAQSSNLHDGMWDVRIVGNLDNIYGILTEEDKRYICRNMFLEESNVEGLEGCNEFDFWMRWHEITQAYRKTKGR